MPHVKTFTLAHLPPEIAVHICLFKDVKNSAFLRQQLLSGNTDFEYAFIDATTVLSTTHVLAAAFRAVNDLLANRLKSRNVHSETVFSLSINNNIAESFRRFGITDTTTSLLCIKIALPSSTPTPTSTPNTSQPITPESVQSHLTTHVHGTRLDFSDAVLRDITDVQKIRKIYKLGDGGGGHAAKGKRGGGGRTAKEEIVLEGSGEGGKGEMRLGLGGDEEARWEMEIAILGMMALKGS